MDSPTQQLIPVNQRRQNLRNKIREITDVDIDLEWVSQAIQPNAEMSQTTIIKLIISLMKVMKMYREISNAQKKQIVLLILEEAIDTSPHLEPLTALVLKEMAPELIDTFSVIGKSKHMFKLKQGIFSRCF